MAIKILPYKTGSGSAKALAEALNVKLLKVEGSRWKPRKQDVLINWGSRKQDHTGFGAGIIINHPNSVTLASNKLKAFQVLFDKEVSTPRFSEDKKEALKWLDDGKDVVCRTILNGHSGEGIVIASSPEEIVDAPLYTSYVKKKEEYRIHVMDGIPFFQQRKARDLAVPDQEVNWQIRNLKGGFIYSHIDIAVPAGALSLATKAVEALGLDFGAVDILVTARGKAKVLEVNTACGLEGTTLTKYVEAFQRKIGG